ncbi:TetR/AcrR family transcriptional regulator [Arthrobacter sp. R4]|uniref:TetR/AcrR family transcriptional regulator n=1 Tax=Arthrobacter sp. R4 TaxID=644417 RepID=UPI003EDA7809
MRPRRFDPSRRDRIIEAALELVAEDGVAGATYRKIAVRADIPLGSLTYHFSGVDDLLGAVFSRFIERAAQSFRSQLSNLHDESSNAPLILQMIKSEGFTHGKGLVLYSELHALAMRRPEWRKPLQALRDENTRSLQRYYDPHTAALVGAVMDSLASRIALDPSPKTMHLATEVIERIVSIKDQVESASISLDRTARSLHVKP